MRCRSFHGALRHLFHSRIYQKRISVQESLIGGQREEFTSLCLVHLMCLEQDNHQRFVHDTMCCAQFEKNCTLLSRPRAAAIYIYTYSNSIYTYICHIYVYAGHNILYTYSNSSFRSKVPCMWRHVLFPLHRNSGRVP